MPNRRILRIREEIEANPIATVEAQNYGNEQLVANIGCGAEMD
jgi:hypothetical protein